MVWGHVSDRVTPVISPQTVAAMEQTGEIIFYGRVYRPKTRILSLRSFLKHGGNWLYLSPTAIKQFVSSPQYRDYLTFVQQREMEIKKLNYNF